MKRSVHTYKLLTFLCFLTISLILSPVTTIVAQPDEGALPELTLEQKKNRLINNFNAVFVAVINYAKEKGETPEQVGTYLGKLFAPGWGESLTPMEFVRGMNRNWQMLDIKVEILETGPGFVKGRHTLAYTNASFNERFGVLGGNIEEYRQFIKSILKGITNHHGLTYDDTLDGEWNVFTVSAD